jgi:L-fucose isomerase-like protein
MLGNKLTPMACEVDVGGVIAMYALTLASGNASALLDWNNNYGEDRNMCVCTHCSNYPKDFMGTEVEISNLDILGKTLGADNCFGAIKGKVAPGPFTYFRVSTDDTSGCVRAYLGEGELVKHSLPMDGGIASSRSGRLNSAMSTSS